jgi:hypothetical protein
MLQWRLVRDALKGNFHETGLTRGYAASSRRTSTSSAGWVTSPAATATRWSTGRAARGFRSCRTCSSGPDGCERRPKRLRRYRDVSKPENPLARHHADARRRRSSGVGPTPKPQPKGLDLSESDLPKPGKLKAGCQRAPGVSASVARDCRLIGGPRRKKNGGNEASLPSIAHRPFHITLTSVSKS